MKDKKLYSTGEVADILGVSRVTVFNKIKSGEIKAEQVGREYAIAHEEVKRLTNTEEITETQKEEVSQAVKKTVDEYGEALRKLGEE